MINARYLLEHAQIAHVVLTLFHLLQHILKTTPTQMYIKTTEDLELSKYVAPNGIGKMRQLQTNEAASDK